MTRRVIQTSFDGVEPAEIGYGGKEACAIVGITYRKLDHWDHIDLVKPSLAPARGSGTQRTYSYRDLLRLRVVKGLRDAGVTLPDAKLAIENLRELHGSDWESATIVVAGKKSVLTRDGNDLIDLVRNGQSVLNIVPLGPMMGDVDARIKAIGGGDTSPTVGEPAVSQASGT
ncbi:MAG: MerR family transcriptional regulator [Acidimicrobiia bacterium]|nr:MerR family transcriptional regulator [Acidimicrobiia bacterium]